MTAVSIRLTFISKIKNLNCLWFSTALSLLFLSACQKHQAVDPVTVDPVRNFNQPEFPHYSYYLNLMNLKETKNHLKIEADPFFTIIENHNEFRKSESEKEKQLPDQFKNINISSIYESFLVKNIIHDSELNKIISAIYIKIFQKMDKIYIENHTESWFAIASERWDQAIFTTLHFIENFEFDDKLVKIKNGESFALSLEFLLFNAKKQDGLGIGSKMTEIRDEIYQVITQERGMRFDKHNGVLRNQYGIARFDIPKLGTSDGRSWAPAWDICHVDTNDGNFNRSMNQLQIPIRCGLSGSTNIALASLLKSKADLNPEEVRLFILSVWASICAVGGHSLQESLSAARISTDFLLEKIITDPDLRNEISEKTLESLREVTQKIDPLSYEGANKTFGKYYDVFFSQIETHTFWEMRKKSQNELLEYLTQETH